MPNDTIFVLSLKLVVPDGDSMGFAYTLFIVKSDVAVSRGRLCASVVFMLVMLALSSSCASTYATVAFGLNGLSTSTRAFHLISP